MNTIRILLACVVLLAASLASAADGLISVKSPYGAKETMDRLEGIVKQRGLNVFARIDYAAGAAKIGKNLRPTEVLIFGNPQGGTPFMECAQSVGIDLPLKALVWQDADNQVWLDCIDQRQILFNVAHQCLYVIQWLALFERTSELAGRDCPDGMKIHARYFVQRPIARIGSYNDAVIAWVERSGQRGDTAIVGECNGLCHKKNDLSV